MASPHSCDPGADSTACFDPVDYPTPADRALPGTNLLDIVPRSQLVAWVKKGDDNAVLPSSRSSPTIERLVVRHVGQLLSELSARTWNAYYEDHVGKRLAPGVVLAIWLTELGVKLPPSHSLMPTDYANLLRDIKAAWSTVACRLKHKPALPFS